MRAKAKAPKPKRKSTAAPVSPPPALNVKSFAKGHVLFKEGDYADSAYVIVSGAVALSRRDGSGDISTFITLRDGEIFGEMALIVDIRRTATATAHEQTSVIVIGRTEFDYHLAQLNPFVLQILKGLVKRLKDTTDAYME
ncbi:MAG: cyclic nucleotide-binding domain-containing protein [Rhodobacteraceae bacterium]|nr:cyclic nucleotide-binding domain-containing protein [Paracoccaceae bacterium]